MCQEVTRPRVGVDGRKFPGAAARGPHGTLDDAAALGFDGVFFRTVLDMSPALDLGELRDIRAHADDLGMYLEAGLGKVNPFATPEMPELRAAGDGDILLGFRRMMVACAEIGCVELWAATTNYQLGYPGKFVWDRFRTDVSWPDQLTATRRFLQKLRPVAKDLGIHVNLETHEEITSFELVELVEAVGTDVCGIVFDTANPLQRLEHPRRTTDRVAPYVRQTQLKDCTVTRVGDGYRFDLVPCGEGLVDFEYVVSAVSAGRPNVTLTIENQESRVDFPGPAPVTVLPIADPDFVTSHGHLTVEEFAAFTSIVGEHEGCSPEVDFGHAEAVAALLASRDHIRSVCDRITVTP
ncbi:sugar phosphate isomerase/epimerase family protein [Actinocrispum wychmicini]|uniref:Sugar phosphate isomerase/epimerase n=1 Tax=Actinocrispum wychmicini TaxID=1213861 RepID=A0A4V2S7E3_9PSEU|nr:sugar phosphate isomerase/epimerase family protein [Actinocrispum wychmicini]TCO59580.1 sugar phosphate isomerase/epimerase [Actinocrispum wychmicini]